MPTLRAFQHAPIMPSRIITRRLTLRRLTPADLPTLTALHTHPEIVQYISPPASASEIKDKLLPKILAEYKAIDADALLGLGVVLLECDGEVVGGAALKPPGAVSLEAGEGVLEIGYRILPPYWGRGYAGEVARALVDYAFGIGSSADPGVGGGEGTGTITKVVGTAMLANVGSCKVLEKAGMRRTRVFMYEPEEGEELLPGAEEGDGDWEIAREEWRAMNSRRVDL